METLGSRLPVVEEEKKLEKRSEGAEPCRSTCAGEHSPTFISLLPPSPHLQWGLWALVLHTYPPFLLRGLCLTPLPTPPQPPRHQGPGLPWLNPGKPSFSLLASPECSHSVTLKSSPLAYTHRLSAEYPGSQDTCSAQWGIFISKI